MTEQIIREAIADKERQRDRVDDANRFGRVESAVAVLRVQFEAALAHAVQGADLKELERKLENEVTKQIEHICDHLSAQNAAQSNDILSKVGQMFTEQKITMAKDQIAQSNALLGANAETRKEIIRYGIGFATTVLASLAVIWLTK